MERLALVILCAFASALAAVLIYERLSGPRVERVLRIESAPTNKGT